MKLSKIATNPEGEENGTWVTMPEGYQVQVRSVNSEAYLKLQQKHAMANRRYTQRRQRPPLEVLQEQALELITEALLVDWRGLEDDDGQAIPVSEAKDILAMRQYRRMGDDIAAAASDMSLFTAAEDEEDAKN